MGRSALPDHLGATLDRLPPPLPDRLRTVAAAADGRAWLVGGGVRDLLLGLPAFDDVDIVIEGRADAVARRLPVEIVKTTAFLTATVRWPDGALFDLVSARSETYPLPGALPEVTPADLPADLARRDFSVNAIAAALAPERWGELVDPCGGRDDLQHRRLRALHPDSFVDDPTRLFRAVRYAVRLGLFIEPDTLGWMATAIDRRCVDLLTPDRLRHELERSLSDASPREQVRALFRHGLHHAIEPDLVCHPGRLAAVERLARAWPGWEQPDRPAWWLVWLLAMLPASGTEAASERLIARLALDGPGAKAVRSMAGLLRGRPPADGSASVWAAWLDGHALEALLAYAAGRGGVEPAIREYLLQWRHTRPALTGADLVAEGVPPGPLIGRILDRLRAARLDGAVASRQDEWLLAREIAAEGDGWAE